MLFFITMIIIIIITIIITTILISIIIIVIVIFIVIFSQSNKMYQKHLKHKLFGKISHGIKTLR